MLLSEKVDLVLLTDLTDLVERREYSEVRDLERGGDVGAETETEVWAEREWRGCRPRRCCC